MDYPKLPKNYIWKITPTRAEIWVKLPDIQVCFSHGISADATTDRAKYTYKEEVLHWRKTSDYGVGPYSFGSEARVLLYERRRCVYSVDVDWSTEQNPEEVLREIKTRWKNVKNMQYGFIE